MPAEVAVVSPQDDYGHDGAAYEKVYVVGTSVGWYGISGLTLVTVKVCMPPTTLSCTYLRYDSSALLAPVQWKRRDTRAASGPCGTLAIATTLLAPLYRAPALLPLCYCFLLALPWKRSCTHAALPSPCGQFAVATWLEDFCCFPLLLLCSLRLSLPVPRPTYRKRALTRAASHPRGLAAVATGLELVRPARCFCCVSPCACPCALPCLLLCFPCSWRLLALSCSLTLGYLVDDLFPFVPSLAAASSSM